jgi:hypothetical protein
MFYARDTFYLSYFSGLALASQRDSFERLTERNPHGVETQHRIRRQGLLGHDFPLLMAFGPKGTHLLHLLIGNGGIGPKARHPVRLSVIENRHYPFFCIHPVYLLW